MAAQNRSITQKILKYIRDPKKIINYVANRGLFNAMPDEPYLKLVYWAAMGKRLNLDDPQTFNEKLQWLKLNDRNPLYTTLVDKYAVKAWVAERIGEEHIIPTLGVWDSPDDIDFDALPDKFVLKCTHNSGTGMCICTDKSKLDIPRVRRELAKGLKENYYLHGREWPYKDVPRRIIAEEYLVDESGTELKDYKVFNFDGEPKLIEVDFDRFVSHKRNLYSTDWEYIEAAIEYPPDPARQIDKPKGLETMLNLARALSAGMSHVRTDFYSIDNRVLFGELTFFHDGGSGKFSPEAFEAQVSSWLKLPGGGYLMKADEVVMYVQVFEDRANNEPKKDDDISGGLQDLKDYKFYCFDGKPAYCQVICNRSTEETIDFFDMDWVHQDFTGLALPHKPYSRSPIPIPIPIPFDDMRKAAATLSEGMPYVRADFYDVGDKMYFGEMTFYPGSGFGVFEPDEWNGKLGDMLDIAGMQA